MTEDQVIDKMRSRIAQCRQLAAYVTDEHTRRVLLQMADDGEADLHRLEADSGDQDNERSEG